MDRRRGSGRLPLRALRTDFLLEAAVLALARWDRLGPAQQTRFRELATKADGKSADNLSAAERQELRGLWKTLGARKLLREVAGRAARTPFDRSADGV